MQTMLIISLKVVSKQSLDFRKKAVKSTEPSILTVQRSVNIVHNTLEKQTLVDIVFHTVKYVSNSI